MATGLFVSDQAMARGKPFFLFPSFSSSPPLIFCRVCRIIVAYLFCSLRQRFLSHTVTLYSLPCPTPLPDTTYHSLREQGGGTGNYLKPCHVIPKVHTARASAAQAGRRVESISSFLGKGKTRRGRVTTILSEGAEQKKKTTGKEVPFLRWKREGRGQSDPPEERKGESVCKGKRHKDK